MSTPIKSPKQNFTIVDLINSEVAKAEQLQHQHNERQSGHERQYERSSLLSPLQGGKVDYDGENKLHQDGSYRQSSDGRLSPNVFDEHKRGRGPSRASHFNLNTPEVSRSPSKSSLRSLSPPSRQSQHSMDHGRPPLNSSFNYDHADEGFKPINASFVNRRIREWDKRAYEGDYDSDLAIVDPLIHLSWLKGVQRDVIAKSEWYRRKGDLQPARDKIPRDRYGGLRLPEWEKVEQVIKHFGDMSPRLTHLYRTYEISCRIAKAANYLQESGFSGNAFNILIENSDNKLAEVVRIPFKLLNDIMCGIREAVLKISSSGYTGQLVDIDLAEYALRPCVAVLSVLNLQFSIYGYPLHSILSLCRMTVLLLDLALVSYVGSHAERFDEEFLRCSTPDITVKDPAIDTLGFSCCLRKLTCLEEFLNHKQVWVFQLFPKRLQKEEKERKPDQRLSILAHIIDIADLWGPVSAIPVGNNPGGPFKQYNTSKGAICRVQDSTSTDVPGAVPCHWYRNGDPTYDPNFEEYLQKDDLLLIGGPFQENKDCKYTLWHFGADFGNKLGHIGTNRQSWKTDSRSVGVSLSKIFGASLGITQKLVPETSIKDLIKIKLTNDPELSNPWWLNCFYGLEISHCTGNARRIQFRDLLVAKSIYPILLRRRPDLTECEWGRAFLKALQSPRDDEIEETWRNYKNFRREMSILMMDVLELLEGTGKQGKGLVAAVLYGNKEKFIELSLHNNNWAAWLQDSSYTAVFAFINERCLPCILHPTYATTTCTFGSRDSQMGHLNMFKGFTTLQTSIRVPADSVYKRVWLNPSGYVLQKLEVDTEDGYMLVESSAIGKPTHYVYGHETENSDDPWGREILVYVKASKDSYGGMDTRRLVAERAKKAEEPPFTPQSITSTTLDDTNGLTHHFVKKLDLTT